MAALTIVGAGLIGCSFASAARGAGLFATIRAVDPLPESARRALALGHVDELVDVPPAGDAVLLACPGQHVVPWLEQLRGHRGVIFDVASVKGALLARLEARGGVPSHFVPCHPIAGRERSGPDAARSDLFAGQKVILTPAPSTDAARVAEVSGWWQAVGARVAMMDPAEHDRVYAATSHLPHLLAFAYLLGVAPEHGGHTGGGFRDFSRIGGSDPTMWSGIFDLNAEALLATLAEFRSQLDRFEAAICAGEVATCAELIAEARARRQALQAERELKPRSAPGSGSEAGAGPDER